MYEDNAELAELEAEIAKVKQQIAAKQANYEEVPLPKTQVGWASYIANNDRGLLDKYQDAERAWYSKLKDQEHAQKLADKQRMQQDIINMDENMKNRSIAAANYQYAVAAREADTSKDPAVEAMLKQKVAEAKATLDYWNKRAGFNTSDDKQKKESDVGKDLTDDKDLTDAESVSKSDQDTPTTDVQIEDYKAIKSVKTQAQKDKILQEMKANPAMKNNSEFREQYNRIKAIMPDDEKAAKKAERKSKWEAGKQLSGYDYRKWKESPEGKALIKEFGE